MPSPEHEAMVERLVTAGTMTPTEPPGREAFATIRASEAGSGAPEPADLHVTTIEVGGVPCIEVRAPDPTSGATIVYFHGGGYIWMTARTHLAVAAGLVRASGARCVSADYRRAPEDPYPAAVNDAVAVYRGLVESGTDPASVVLAGDSAGGGLVLGALVALRDAGDPLPAGAVCLSPWTDLAVTGPSADAADDPVVTGDALRMMASLYLDGASPQMPTASPLYADLTGLPPLLVQVGTRESLLDDARRVVERAKSSGVDAQLIELDGVVHMWVVFGPDIPESIDAFASAARFVRERTQSDFSFAKRASAPSPRDT